MTALGPWMARPRRLHAIVADGHPIPDLKYFEAHPLPCPSVGPFRNFCRVFFISFVFHICVGAYVMTAQGPWMARSRRLDAIVADGHPVPDLKYLRQCEVRPRRLSGSTGRTRVPYLVTLGIYASMPIRMLSTVHSTALKDYYFFYVTCVCYASLIIVSLLLSLTLE